MSRFEKIKVKKKDVLRAMLTETLPYEVPLLFSNEGFYRSRRRVDANRLKTDFELDIFDEKKWRIPYTYKIRKNSIEFRTLAVMHPASQLAVASFYSKYDSILLALCRRSNWALRAPHTIASHYVEKHRVKNPSLTKNDTVEAQQSWFDSVNRTASSYFVYHRYNLLYKFFESTEFHALEKQFLVLRKLDIASCFARIYTHTIAWAIKSKKFAKANKPDRKNERFEEAFDSLMQSSNYGETAGIIVGPEVSRIFAEVILQRVDVEIQRKLNARKPSMDLDVHYQVRRYVDDYFVFANDETTLDIVQDQISDCLLEYKLSLNLTKTQTMSRPFSTSETGARIELAAVVSEFFRRHAYVEETTTSELQADGTEKEIVVKRVRPKSIYNADGVANTLIRDVKRSLKSNDADFDGAANYFFKVAKRQLVTYSNQLKLSKLDVSDAPKVADFLCVLLDLIFFFYAMTPRVRQTYVVSEIIILMMTYARNAAPSTVDRIATKIIAESTLIMRSMAERKAENNVETLNLLIGLSTLGSEYCIDQTLLLKLLQLEFIDGKIAPNNSQFGYFQFASSLYYMGAHAAYNDLRTAICRYVIARFETEEAWEDNAELVFLFLDFLRAPYVSADAKIELAKLVLKRKSDFNLNARAAQLIEYVGATDWFFLWQQDIDLADVLERKNLRTPY